MAALLPESVSSDDALAALAGLGAHRLAHINGDLFLHLKGTHDLLARWQAPRDVCMAGLFHAVYGTAGFADQLLPLERREDVARLIGAEAESLVYLFCACDRADFYDRLNRREQPLRLRDRFHGHAHVLTPWQAAALSELTLANEVEIALHAQDAARARQLRLVGALLPVLGPHLSAQAIRDARAAVAAGLGA